MKVCLGNTYFHESFALWQKHWTTPSQLRSFFITNLSSFSHPDLCATVQQQQKTIPPLTLPVAFILFFFLKNVFYPQPSKLCLSELARYSYHQILTMIRAVTSDLYISLPLTNRRAKTLVFNKNIIFMHDRNGRWIAQETLNILVFVKKKHKKTSGSVILDGPA